VEWTLLDRRRIRGLILLSCSDDKIDTIRISSPPTDFLYIHFLGDGVWGSEMRRKMEDQRAKLWMGVEERDMA
jgi:hypothetical protein